MIAASYHDRMGLKTLSENRVLVIVRRTLDIKFSALPSDELVKEAGNLTGVGHVKRRGRVLRISLTPGDLAVPFVVAQFRVADQVLQLAYPEHYGTEALQIEHTEPERLRNAITVATKLSGHELEAFTRRFFYRSSEKASPKAHELLRLVSRLTAHDKRAFGMAIARRLNLDVIAV